MPTFPAKRDDLVCADCGALMVLRRSQHFNNLFYGCSRWPDCRGSHGANADGSPKGTPANKATRLARIQAHRIFDLVWKTKALKRNEAYKWMRRVMNLPHSQAHISQFNEMQCLELQRLVKRDFPQFRTRYDAILYEELSVIP